MKCTNCELDKQEEEFYIRRDTKQRRKQCNKCISDKRKITYYKDTEKTKAKQKASYVKHRDKRLAYHKEYYVNNKEKALWMGARNRSKERELPFNITFEDIIIPEKCPVLGIPLSLDNNKLEDDSPTLDRLIPSLGYIKGNTLVISNKANRMKNDATVEEVQLLLEWMKKEIV